jgi:DNA-binding XRE family transcriptional regulator
MLNVNQYSHVYIYSSIMVYIMPSKAPTLFPAQTQLLEQLGGRLRDARLRRRFAMHVVAERAGISRQTLYNVEAGDASVNLGTYARVLAVLGLEQQLALIAADDPVGRRLQDAQLPVKRRAPKTKRGEASV